MKQKINPSNKEEYEIIEEKKSVKDVKEQRTNDQQLPEVRRTKQNDTKITTAPKEKATTRSQITERRLGATKQGQLKNNKYEDQKAQEQQGEGKDSCPNCKKYVREGVKCGLCDRQIHYKCEELTQQQVEEEYPNKIPYICSADRKKIEEKITRQWKAKYKELIHRNINAQGKIKIMKKKVKEVDKNYSELKSIHQRAKSNMKI